MNAIFYFHLSDQLMNFSCLCAENQHEWFRSGKIGFSVRMSLKFRHIYQVIKSSGFITWTNKHIRMPK